MGCCVSRYKDKAKKTHYDEECSTDQSLQLIKKIVMDYMCSNIICHAFSKISVAVLLPICSANPMRIPSDPRI